MNNLLPVRFGIIQKIILVLAVLAMAIIWPLSAFSVSHVSECVWNGMRISGPSNENEYVRQEFSPNFKKLESVSVYVVNDPESIDTMKAVLRVYDYTGVCLSEKFFQLEEYELPGYVTVPVELQLVPGTLYFYTIGGVDGDVMVAYCGDESKTAENGALFYKEVPSGGTSIATKYEYERPMGIKRIIAFDMFIIFAVALFILAIQQIKNRIFSKEKDSVATLKWQKVEKCVKVAAYSVIGIITIVSFWGIVISRLFTDDVLNIIVLFVGVLIACAIMAYYVFICKSELEPLDSDEATLMIKIINIIRAIVFAAIIIMCCMQVNGYSDYEKGLHIRRMLVFFGLYIFLYGSRKQIWNIPNFIWSVLAFVGGKYYISLNSAHIEHIKTATCSAWVMWVMGLLVIQFFYRMIAKEWKMLKNISIPTFVIVVLFWICCAIFSNGRQWPALLCVTFVVWIIFYAMNDNKQQLLEDICNGVLIAFFATLIFCFCRRPYQYYILNRYGGVYFTVTAAALYYMAPGAAALTKILLARKDNFKNKLFTAWIVYGIVVAYIGFTASRTGILAMSVMTLFALLIPWKNENKKGFFNRQIKTAGIMMVSVAMMFIMSFSLTRMLPAMSSNPFYYPFEETYACIKEDTPWKGVAYTSQRYIDFQMVLEKLFGKVFAIESESKSTMLEIQAGPMLVSASDNLSGVSDAVINYSNGRFDIFKAYWDQLNLNGHETMSAVAENGENLVHAHNSYLQLAFDFGVPTGIFFLIICFIIFVRSLLLAYCYGKSSVYEMFPLLVVVGFGVSSLVEWVYYPYNPMGFVFLIMFAPIAMKRNKSKK